MSRQAPKTVFFLGAGFSKAVAELPTMNAFFKDEDLTKEAYSHMSKFIKGFFGDSNPNLEEIVTYMDLEMSEFGGEKEGALGILEKARQELEGYVVERFYWEFLAKKRENSEFEEKYGAYVEKLRKVFGNSYAILTLNYDLIVEGVLEFSNRGKIKRLEGLLGTDNISNKELVEEFSGDMLLKLHGSLDWLCCSTFECPFTLRRSMHNQLSDGRFPEEKPNCGICGRPLSRRLIIPPSLYKSSDRFNPLIFRIWRLAREILLKADKIVIIGVSFAESDYHLKWLFKSAMAERASNLPKIEVVNKNERVCNKVRNITGVIPEFEMSFDKYLMSLIAEKD